MMHVVRRFARGDAGQAAVEFALVLPLLLVLVIGIIEFGRAWNEHQVLTDAARQGARIAVVADTNTTKYTTDSIARQVKRALARAGVNPDSARVTVTGFSRPPNTGNPCTVAVTLPYQFTFFGPMIRWATGQRNIVLSTSFTMRNE